MASRRKRGPVALRPRVCPGLPLSNAALLYRLTSELCQFVKVLKRLNNDTALAYPDT
jgi:hypothetical protein